MSTVTTTTSDLASADVLRARESLLMEMYAASDRWEADRFGEFVAADVSFQFGNGDAARGVEVIQATMAHMKTMVTEIRHRVRSLIHGGDDHVTAVIDMHYVRVDGATLDVPAMVLFHFNAAEVVDEYRISMDPGSFFE